MPTECSEASILEIPLEYIIFAHKTHIKEKCNQVIADEGQEPDLLTNMVTSSLTLACAIQFCGSVNLLMSVAYGSSGSLMRSQSMDFNPAIPRTASREVQDHLGSINYQGSKAKCQRHDQSPPEKKNKLDNEDLYYRKDILELFEATRYLMHL